MTNAAIALVFAAGWTGQTYPEETDILRGQDTTPQIHLVLDTSGSMDEQEVPTECSWFYSTYNEGTYGPDPDYPLDRGDMLKASLVGCMSGTDGILDKWDTQVVFAIREFGGDRTGLLAPFDPSMSSHAALEAAVLGLPTSGATPLAEGFADAATYMASFFDDDNSEPCRQNFIVLMTDGVGNQNPGTIVLGPRIQTIEDTDNDPFTPYPLGTDPCTRSPPYADCGASFLFDDHTGSPLDALPNVSNEPPGVVQPIRTYTIGFQAPSDGALVLAEMALRGDGQYYPATNFAQLDNAFEQILTGVLSRSSAAFSPGSLQTDGLFSGNTIYVSAFRPSPSGPWLGTTKKYCVFPANPNDRTCLLEDNGSGALRTNRRPQDRWTGNTTLEGDQGGTGELIWTQVFGVSSDSDPVPSNPLGQRNLQTWLPGGTDYIPLTDSALSPTQTFSNGPCAHWSLINKLHGFTAQVTDCEDQDYTPPAFDIWPLADTVHGGSAIIAYAEDCDTPGNCVLATVANDGMLHLFDTADGVEVQGIVPGHLWRPGTVPTHLMRDLMDQPNQDQTHRYLFDGVVRLFHDDPDRNGYINSGETAVLVAGLGRGGKSYVLWDVSTMDLAGGRRVLNATRNPPKELMVDSDSAFRHLRETWVAPWFGRHRHTDGSLYTVAVFPSGHERTLDEPTAVFAQAGASGLAPPTGDSETNPQTLSCTAFGLPTDLCTPPIQSGTCVPCNDADGDGCPAAFPIVGGTNPYCYDWPGWADPIWGVPPPYNFANTGPGLGHDIVFGPFSWSDATYQGIAFQPVFSDLTLQPNDYVAVLDRSLNEVGRLTGPQPPNTALPWVYDTQFHLRFRSNGIDETTTQGFQLSGVNFIRQQTAPSIASGPTVYIVNLDAWRGASFPGFAEQPGTSDDRQQNVLLARITSSCEGIVGANEVCIDQGGTGGAPPQPDLAYMVCPISAAPAVYTEGGILRTVYFADECGQIWSAARESTGWRVRRILRTNNADGSGATLAGRQSKDYRKIFVRPEIVVSTCNGSRSVGVYFGTGNLQRPALLDNLEDPAVADLGSASAVSGIRNVFGVVWDRPGLPNNLGLEDLENVTTVLEVADPRAGNGQNGWYIEVPEDAKVLREPVVLDSVAFFKAYQPLTSATECLSATGRETVYAVNNCTAFPASDGGNGVYEVDSGGNGGDRVVQQRDADVGGEFLVISRQEEKTAVYNLTGGEAEVPGLQETRAVNIFMWRLRIDPVL